MLGLNGEEGGAGSLFPNVVPGLDPVLSHVVEIIHDNRPDNFLGFSMAAIA